MHNKKGFILYFDILGYKNLINPMAKESKKRLKFILDNFSERQCWLNFVFNFGDGLIKNKEKLFMKSFSDNFLFLYESIDFNECNTESKKINYYLTLNNIMCVASMIQSQFLEQGILIRGSISFGEIAYNTSIIYGKDLVNAIELEEGHSEPSIVLDNYFKTIADNKMFSYRNSVSPFHYHNTSSHDHKEIIKGINTYLSYLDLSTATIEDKEHILEKINWIIEAMNNYFVYKNVVKYELSKDLKLIIKQ